MNAGSPPPPFPPDRLAALRALRRRLRGEPVAPPDLRRLEEEWSWVGPEDEEDRELLALSAPGGEPSGAAAPRWLVHLLGLSHCTAHIGLATASGLVLVQLRSERKRQFPGAWDMAVTGHLSLPAGELLRPGSHLHAAERELREELGLEARRFPSLLRPPGLAPIGGPVEYDAVDDSGPRPWCDREVRRLFGAVLQQAAVEEIRYSGEELSGLLLCRPADALRLAAGPRAAAGMAESMEEFVRWLGELGGRRDRT